MTESLFLSLWASSKKATWNWNFFNYAKQIFIPSYVVTQTSNYPCFIFSEIISSLNSYVGIKLTTLKKGAHFVNSFIQFDIVDLGAIIKWGWFLMFRLSFTYARNEIA